MSEVALLGDSPMSPRGARDCPYQGLDPYSEEDAEFFFGRGADCEIVVANLLASRLTLLYGPSGVGKSSLIHAGVVPRLREMSDEVLRRRGVRDLSVVVFSQWRNDALTALGEAVRSVMRRDFPESFPDVADALPVSAPLSVEVLATWTSALDADLLIVFDQFEEYFLYSSEEATTTGFAHEWARVLNSLDLRVHFLVSLREDALARMDRFEGYIPHLFDNYVRLEHLDGEGARAAIEMPVEKYNEFVPTDARMSVEPALVDMLLEELQSGRVSVTEMGMGGLDERPEPLVQIETPYLQLVLIRLWEEELRARSHVLRRETLDRLGGAERIVRRHLDTVMSRLPPQQLDLCAAVFRYLVTPSGSKIAYSCEDLAEYAGEAPDQVRTVLEKLSTGEMRILCPVRVPVGESAEWRFEIFHDVLAASVLDWRGRYVAEQEQGAKQRQLLAERSAAEQQARAAARRALRAWTVAASLALLLVATVVLGWATLDSQRKADAHRLLSLAAAELHSDPNGSLRYALAAYREKRSTNAESAVRLAVSDSGLVQGVLKGHSGAVFSTHFSPDGRLIATSGEDGTVRLWNASTGTPIRTLTAGTSLHRVAFNKNGTLIAAAAHRGSVHLWRADTGQLLGTFEGGGFTDFSWARIGVNIVLTYATGGPAHVWNAWTPKQPLATLGDKVYGADMSPDGQLVATAEETGQLRIWRWSTPTSPVASMQRDGGLSLPRFSPDLNAPLVVALGGDNELLAWQWQKPARPQTISKGAYHAILDISFRQDGKFLLVAGDKQAQVFDVRDFSSVVTLQGHSNWVNQARYSPDGLMIATASSDGTGRLWNAWGGGRPIAELRPPPGGVYAAAFDPTRGTSIVTAGAGGTARIWTVPCVVEEVREPGWVLRVENDQNSSRFLTVSSERTDLYGDSSSVKVWRPDVVARVAADCHESPGSRSPLVEPEQEGKSIEQWGIQDATFTADGSSVLTTSTYDTGIVQWDWRTGKRQSNYTLGDPPPGADLFDLLGLAVSSDGTWVAAGDNNNNIHVWNASSHRLSRRMTDHPGSNSVLSLDFSPRDPWLAAAASTDGTARLWDVRSGRLLHRLHGHSASVNDVRFNDDGRYVVTASDDGTAAVFNAETGRREGLLQGQMRALLSATFDKTSRLVAASAVDGTVLLWDWQRGVTLAALHRHGDVVNDVTFDPTGTYLISGSDDGSARVYRCDTCGDMAQVLSLADQRERAASGR